MDNRLAAMRQCFQPRQWFLTDGEPEHYSITEEDSFMWVFLEIDGKFVVGFFTPEKVWTAESVHATREAAAVRTNYLNGGKRGP